jgi:hypothetical protein
MAQVLPRARRPRLTRRPTPGVRVGRAGGQGGAGRGDLPQVEAGQAPRVSVLTRWKPSATRPPDTRARPRLQRPEPLRMPVRAGRWLRRASAACPGAAEDASSPRGRAGPARDRQAPCGGTGQATARPGCGAPAAAHAGAARGLWSRRCVSQTWGAKARARHRLESL